MTSTFDNGELQAALDKAVKATANDNEARLKVLASLDKARKAVQQPGEILFQYIPGPAITASIVTAIDFKVFSKLGDGECSLKDIAENAEAEEYLILRIMRVLVVAGLVEEADVKVYRNLPAGKLIADDTAWESGFRSMWALLTPSFSQMPKVLSQTRKSPDTDPVIFKEAIGQEYTMFSYLAANPGLYHDFSKWMGMMSRMSQTNWYDIYPVRERLLVDACSDSPLLVDVGGSHGHDIAKFHTHFPDATGQLIVQDLPNVLDGITDLDAAIKRMPHDIFTPQPVIGARAYFFRQVFHDFSDSDCRRILQNLRPAMKKGYSRLLINDQVIPERDAPYVPVMLDITMMNLLAAKDRSKTQWNELLESEGYEVVSFWSSANGAEGFVEASLKD